MPRRVAGGADLARRRRAPRRRCTRRSRCARSAPPSSRSTSATREWIPVRRSWRLNERHYGDLQGKNKKETAEQFGAEQVKMWRRSYDVPPPPLDDRRPELGLRRALRRRCRRDVLPRSECLKDVLERMLPVVVRRDRSRSPHGCDRARRRARQLVARAREAPRRHDAGARSSSSTCRPASRSSTSSTTTCGRSASRRSRRGARSVPRPRTRALAEADAVAQQAG